MIAVLAIAAALQGLTRSVPLGPPTSLSVRTAGASHAAQVPLVTRTDGRVVVRADRLTDALGGSTRRLSNGHFAVTVPGVTLEMADQSSFATSSAGVVPLPSPTSVDDGNLYIPLAVVVDVLPRLATGVLYDPARTELRVFTPLVTPGGVREASRRTPGGRDGGMVAADVRRDVGDGATVDGSAVDVGTGADTETAGVGQSGDELVPESGAGAPDNDAVVGRRHLVVVDAGHGGPDHGMVGPPNGGHTLYEKNVTLAVALKVGAALQRRGVQVMQTRTRDTLIALADRGRMANEHKGDLFLSIHVNAANPNWHDPAAARGFETYFLAEAKTEDARRVERIENEAVRFETGADATRRDPVNYIIDDMHQNEHLRESAQLADIIQRRLGRVHPGPDRGVKQAGFRVLVTAFMPAVLVEIGFGTNAAEARFLGDPSEQSKLANAIAAATVEYLAHYERRVSTAAQ